MKIFKLNAMKGFTLIEMAVVLLILGLLIGTGFTTLGAYLDNAKQSHTHGSLSVTKRALLDYVMVNRHMPCPDTDNDGEENREADFTCTAATGTVPFNAIGLGVGVTQDDWGNVFAYGVNTDVLVAANIDDSTNSASYFNNQSAPVFTLTTPPIVTDPDVAESYTVCKKTAAACDATDSNVEVNSIPAVIVAFNENGGATSLAACNSETGREQENCNDDLFLWKRVFGNGVYDDQIVTISGYEIKQQIMDLLNAIELTIDEGEFAGYEVIIRRDVDSANDLNVKATGDNAFYVEGDFNANVTMSSGVDKLKVTGDIEANGDPKMGAGDDILIVEGSILVGSVTALGTGDDSATIGGVLAGKLDAGAGNDTVVVSGDVVGEIDMGTGHDDLTVNGLIEAGSSVDGGSDNPGPDEGGDYLDVIRVNQTEAEFRATSQEDYITRFETIYFTDGSSPLPLP